MTVYLTAPAQCKGMSTIIACGLKVRPDISNAHAPAPMTYSCQNCKKSRIFIQRFLKYNQFTWYSPSKYTTLHTCLDKQQCSRTLYSVTRSWQWNIWKWSLGYVSRLTSKRAAWESTHLNENIYRPNMANVVLEFKASVGDLDPQSCPLLIIGQLGYLQQINWTQVKGKLLPVVTKEARNTSHITYTGNIRARLSAIQYYMSDGLLCVV